SLVAGYGSAAMNREGRQAEATPRPAPAAHAATAAATNQPAAGKVDRPNPAKRIEFRSPLLGLHAEVQTELKLTAEQSGKIREIVREVDARAKGDNTPVKPLQFGEPAEAANQRIAAIAKALRDVLPEILTDAQALRLRQLERQAAGMTSF